MNPPNSRSPSPGPCPFPNRDKDLDLIGAAHHRGGPFVFTENAETIFESKMIYLNKTTDAQVVFIPRDTDHTGTLQLTARSTVGLDIPITATMVDLKVHRLCYALAITLPEDLATGEYEYTLKAGGEKVSTGVLVVLDSLENAEQYNKDITYEQYEGQ